MAWYDDRSRTQFVGTYANEKQLQWDVDAARKRGWTVQVQGEGTEQTIGGEGEASPIAAGRAMPCL